MRWVFSVCTVCTADVIPCTARACRAAWPRQKLQNAKTFAYFLRLALAQSYCAGPRMLLPLLGLAYAGVVLYNILVVSKLSLNVLYTWHPICANLFIVFATLGMAAAQSIRGKVAQSRATKEPYVTRHAIFNWLALFSLAGAAATIYLNKERSNRPHFTTYHGITGGATGLFFVANVLGGGAMNTVPSLYKYIKFHRLNGYLIFAAVLAAHGTAVWRGYAGFKTDQYGKYGLVGLLGLMLVATLSSVKLSLLPGSKAKSN